MKRRRELLIILSALAFAPRTAFTPRTAFAQPKKAPILIGSLSLTSRERGARDLAAFRDGLAALGWKEGSQFVIEERWADGREDRLPSLARELVAKKPAVILASQVLAALSAIKEAPKIPIVMVGGGDPVATGLAASLGRPGGMVTGVTGLTADLSEKYLEFLLLAVPKVKRVGFLSYAHHPSRARIMETARRSAARHSVEARIAEAGKAEEIEPTLSRLAKEGAQALVVLPGALLLTERLRIAKFALAHRWPMIGGPYEYAEDGALLSYGADRLANHRRGAYFVDRILKGAKPADLPVEQATKFELVINMKTARALKLEIPRDLAVRADRVIE